MSDDVVADASVLALAVGGKSPDDAELRRRLSGATCHSPHLIDAELGSVLRRHARAGLLGAEEAGAGLRAGEALIDHRYPHFGALARGAWALRENLSFYDALYVALAAALELPLITADARLAGAPALPCAVELI